MASQNRALGMLQAGVKEKYVAACLNVIRAQSQDLFNDMGRHILWQTGHDQASPEKVINELTAGW